MGLISRVSSRTYRRGRRGKERKIPENPSKRENHREKNDFPRKTLTSTLQNGRATRNQSSPANLLVGPEPLFAARKIPRFAVPAVQKAGHSRQGLRLDRRDIWRLAANSNL